ncbi:TPA: glycosyltransferase [Candidatus Woesearchaeota archaeon]|nr:glycosyltransferase [Candidatus Woesearchaeota archaeon]
MQKKSAKKALKLSVIVTTHNRADALEMCLKALADQSYPKPGFEVIVIDDGSSEETGQLVKELASSLPIRIRYSYQEHMGRSGVSKARNKGITEAKARHVLIMGDDIIASREFLMEHMRIHEEHKNAHKANMDKGEVIERGSAVLGLTEWHPKLKATLFMNFLINEGHQFNYKGIKDRNNCGYGMFYTSNISLATSWFTEELFDEEMFALEDVELGYRLEKKGLKIVFNPRALAYHYHPITEEQFYNKIRNTSINAVHMYRKFPELKDLNALRTRARLASIALRPIIRLTPLIKALGLKRQAWTANIIYNSAVGILERMGVN